MKKIFALVLALTMVLALCACGAAPKTEPTKEPDSTATPAPTDEAQVTSPAKVDIQPATDEALAKYSAPCELGQKSAEYAQKLLVTVSADVKDLTVFDLAGEEKGDVFAFTETSVGSVPELKADNALVIWASFPGTLPVRGFSFVDGTGVTRHFAIEESGMDGSMFLTELDEADDGTLVYKQA